MRQLTALDALFLAAENDRTQGHVSAMGVYDRVTDEHHELRAVLRAVNGLGMVCGGTLNP